MTMWNRPVSLLAALVLAATPALAQDADPRAMIRLQAEGQLHRLFLNRDNGEERDTLPIPFRRK